MSNRWGGDGRAIRAASPYGPASSGRKGGPIEMDLTRSPFAPPPISGITRPHPLKWESVSRAFFFRWGQSLICIFDMRDGADSAIRASGGEPTSRLVNDTLRGFCADGDARWRHPVKSRMYLAHCPMVTGRGGARRSRKLACIVSSSQFP